MTLVSEFGGEDAAWRAVEVEWLAWLRASYPVVKHLGAATGNHPRSGAPLISIGDHQVRAPDIETKAAGVTTYWEVKYRSRSHVDAVTGVREHWMSYASFQDYVELSQAESADLWIVIYEAPTSTSPGRWLKGNVLSLLERGRDAIRIGRGGDEVQAWVWPVANMEVVQGPRVDLPASSAPVLADEGSRAPLGDEVLAPVERRLRRTGVALAERSVASPEEVAAATAIETDLTSGLDVLSRGLGLPSTPRYSVLRVSAGECDLEELLGFLDYGIRVFLITGPGQKAAISTRDLAPFVDARLLEWAELDYEPLESHWAVDGSGPVPMPSSLAEALVAADATSDINLLQYSIVHAPRDADILVTAGAGTGKTETMSERLLFLLATSGSSTDPGGRPLDLRVGDVALVTFTREAAREMRGRLARTLLLRQRMCSLNVHPIAWLLQLGTADISTIHTFARRVIQETGGLVGLSPAFKVSAHTMTFRSLAMEALSPHLADLFEKYPGRKDVPAAYLWLDHITAVWEALGNNGVDLLGVNDVDVATAGDVDWGAGSLDEQSSDFVRVTREVILELAGTFASHCLDNDSIPTNELVPAAVAALRKSSDPALSLRYLFVDEFQDTDPLQMQLLLEVRRQLGLRLFVVGDAKQGIYRFRGAEGNAFDQLRSNVATFGLPPLREFNLTRNFRTEPALLDSLHPHFRNWGTRGLLPYADGDRLRAGVRSGGQGKQIQLGPLDKDQRKDFATWAAAVVSQWRRENPAASIAILCRRNSHAIAVQRAIHAKDGQCELVVGGDFFDTEAVREMRVLLDAVLDPDDDAALLELAESRWSGGVLGTKRPSRVGDDDGLWNNELVSPIAWPDRLAGASDGGNFEREDLRDLRLRVRALRQAADHMSTLEWIVDCAATFSPESCRRDGGAADEDERRRYARCIDHLITLMDEQFANSAVTIERVAFWLRLQIVTRQQEDVPFEQDDTEGRTTALTVHKAKGLEFDLVLVPNTWTRFGPPWGVTTNVAVLRQPSRPPRVAWRWQPGDGVDVTNVSTSEHALWSVDADETAREETRLLYVALTRARKELRVFTARGLPPSDAPSSWHDLLQIGAAT